MRVIFRQLRSTMKNPSRKAVTLVIYGWHESEPGTLAWVFPSVRAALRAVRAMRNAIAWLIVEGRRGFDGDVDLEALRRAGAVLVESTA
jgi:hypothetical protein